MRSETMRAIVIPKHGGPEVLQFTELPKPFAGPGEVVVRVAATSLNRLDLWARSGPPVKIFPWKAHEFPIISGSDCTGWVDKAGEGVDGFEPGQPVIVYPGLSCGGCEYCRAGEQSQCLSYRIFGEHTDGAMAEHAAVPAKNLLVLPSDADLLGAAAIPVAYTTAWRMLITAAKLQPGETVLVLGVGGGVGSAALRISLLTGATVYSAASSEPRREQAIAFGAQGATNSREPFSGWVLEQTDGRGADVVVDPLGITWQESIRSLARGGRLVVCGATGGNKPEFDIRELYQRHRMIVGAPLGNWSDFRSVADLFLSGSLKPIIDAVYTLRDAQQAHQRAEGNESFGKIVMQVAEALRN